MGASTPVEASLVVVGPSRFASPAVAVSPPFAESVAAPSLGGLSPSGPPLVDGEASAVGPLATLRILARARGGAASSANDGAHGGGGGLMTAVPLQDPPFAKRMSPVMGFVKKVETSTVGGEPTGTMLIETDGDCPAPSGTARSST
jgi:hypothetical protein